MSWTYRVVKRVFKGFEDEPNYSIHEVYTDPEAMTEKPMVPQGNSVEELRATLEMMMEALDKPVMDYAYNKPEADPQQMDIEDVIDGNA